MYVLLENIYGNWHYLCVSKTKKQLVAELKKDGFHLDKYGEWSCPGNDYTFKVKKILTVDEYFE
jgi:hypothetical protein